MRVVFIQTCRSLFQHHDTVISHTFIRSLTPLLINHLNQAPHNESIDKQEVALCVATMEVLIQLAAAEQRKLSILESEGEFINPTMCFGCFFICKLVCIWFGHL